MKLAFRAGYLACVSAIALGAFIAPSSATTVVNVSLWDKGTETEMPKGLALGQDGNMKMAPLGVKIDRETVQAGKVIFRVTNNSKDMVHEMLVASVSDPKHPLPYVAKDDRVDEGAAHDLGEVSELDPGKTGELSLDLSPGTYVLFCNVPSHMEAGMWALLTVKK